MQMPMNSDMPFSGKFLPALVGMWLCVAGIGPALGQANDDDPDDDGVPIVGAGSSQSEGANELRSALMRLASNPRDIPALVAAGNAALELGDDNAAVGFFVRAAQLAPDDGKVKAGLASALVRRENPYDALALFDEAVKLGVSEREIAADRALAFDLVGDNASAQRNYQMAILDGSPPDAVIRNYAMSLAISGQKSAAEEQLLPLLRKQDSAAWRTRAFVYAVSDDEDEAVSIAYATMPRDLASNMAPYLRYMGRLTPAQQAAAAAFGHFPRTADIGRENPRNARYARNASSQLIPQGEPLVSGKGVRTKQAKPSREKRRRPGKDGIATAAAEPPVAPKIEPQAPLPVPQDLTAAANPLPPAAASSAAAPSGAALPVAQSTPRPDEQPARDASNDAAGVPVADSGQLATSQAEEPPKPAIPGFASLGGGVSANSTTGEDGAENPAPDAGAEPPVQPFDLAELTVQQKANKAAAATPNPEQTQPVIQDVPRSFNAIMGTIDVPAEQLAMNEDAVDITSFEPPRPKPMAKSEPKPEKPKPPAHPSRHWVQVAGGANVKTLPREWKRLSDIAPGAFKDKKGYWTPLRFTNRLLAGPFESEAAAQDFVNLLAKSDISAFTFTSPEGQEITPLNTD